MHFFNGFWFYSILAGWSTWQWVFLNSSINFWSFDIPDTPGSASAVIWNRFEPFLLQWIQSNLDGTRPDWLCYLPGKSQTAPKFSFFFLFLILGPFIRDQNHWYPCLRIWSHIILASAGVRWMSVLERIFYSVHYCGILRLL